MSGWYLQNLLLLSVVTVTLVAWLKGGWAERLGASANMLAALAILGIQAALPTDARSLGFLAIDGVLGLALLALALRFTSLWIGMAMLLQAGQFSLHAFYHVTEKPFDRLFAVVNNSVSWGILLAVLAGTLATWATSRRSQVHA